MAIEFFGSTQNGTTSYSHSSGSGADRILFVCTRQGGGDGDTISSITYNGDSLTKIGVSLEPGDSTWVGLWMLISPSAGINTLSISMTGGFIQSTSASYSGVEQGNQPDEIATHTATNTANTTASLTTIDDNCWTILACSQRVNTTAGAGSTKRSDQCFDSNGPITPASSTSMTIGGGDPDTDWGVIMASFSPSLGNQISYIF